VADYLRLHAEVSVELNLNDRFVDLVDEGYDLALRVWRGTSAWSLRGGRRSCAGV